MHNEAYSYVQRTVAGLPKRKSVIEIGSYNVNGSVRDLFPGVDYTGVDVRPGNGVDVVSDGAAYSPEQPVDTVVMTECLEHASDAVALIANAYTILEPGGVFLLTAAGPERTPHGSDGGAVGDEFYRNIDPDELAEWLNEAGFDTIALERDEQAGDVYALAVKPNPGRQGRGRTNA